MYSIMNSNDLLNEINRLRKEMIYTGMKKGLSNADTISCSKKLDELIIKYQRKNNFKKI
ncbi:aspartyl-phosphate phosphatase Spo0E family protein [Bacillus sp. B1-b2]|uniref:aspartyl-phosphate phosphatase Spo0E family protein n=1 Tax=Bacillus sp. B1-b2 TaxID=2653201 RepID=UPI00126232FD|nr:aspartyl-phosphate phosphatase Spo0E family protein [Bacillus sp. B1-b2]KAB7668898.1 aspartyl-phosphate phosphatase Spo0E family protein [Bacillus sp. B1-b2]